MKQLQIGLLLSILCVKLFSQPFTPDEIKWLRMVNDEQAFAEFPGFREIKEYQQYFGRMVKDYRLSDEEIDFIGRWGIPTGIYQEKKEGYLQRLKNEKLKQVLNGSFIGFFPDRTFVARYYHYDEFFPLRALIGKWKIENDTLYAKVERIITVKVPLKLGKNKSCILKPDDFIEKDIQQDWKILLTDVNTSYDKKLRYLYKPFNTLLSSEDVELNFEYSKEPIRESSFSQEAFFYSYELEGEYMRLQDYLKGKTKVWDYIGTEVHLMH